MKKLLTLTAIALLALATAACGGPEAPKDTTPAKIGDRVSFANQTTNCSSKEAFNGMPGSREFYCKGYVNAKSTGTIAEIDTPFTDRPDLSHYCVAIDGWSSVKSSLCFWFYRDSFTVIKKEKL